MLEILLVTLFWSRVGTQRVPELVDSPGWGCHGSEIYIATFLLSGFSTPRHVSGNLNLRLPLPLVLSFGGGGGVGSQFGSSLNQKFCTCRTEGSWKTDGASAKHLTRIIEVWEMRLDL